MYAVLRSTCLSNFRTGIYASNRNKRYCIPIAIGRSSSFTDRRVIKIAGVCAQHVIIVIKKIKAK